MECNRLCEMTTDIKLIIKLEERLENAWYYNLKYERTPFSNGVVKGTQVP